MCCEQSAFGARRAAAWPFRVAAARASMRTLAKMDRRELADIGLNPSDLRDASALPLDRDPTRAAGATGARAAGERLCGSVFSGRTFAARRSRWPSPARPSAGAAGTEARPAGRPLVQNRLSCAPASAGATRRLAEEVGAQLPRRLVVAEPARGHLEPAPDHPGVGARARPCAGPTGPRSPCPRASTA